MSDNLHNEILRLNALGNLARGLEPYFKTIFHQDNKIVATGAALVILSNGTLNEPECERLITLAEAPLLRSKAFEFFLSTGRLGHAQKLINFSDPDPGNKSRGWLDATFYCDYKQIQSHELNEYFTTGNLENIGRCASAAEALGGYREALPLFVSATLIDPKNSNWPFHILNLAGSANRLDLVLQTCEIFEKIDIYPSLTSLFRAHLEISAGHADKAINRVSGIDQSKLPRMAVNFLKEILIKIYERSNNYSLAYKFICELKEGMRTPSYFEGNFIEHIKERSEYHYVDQADNKEASDTVHLVGFPRSGTTLLENMLNSHPDIETFEEIPSMQSVRAVIDRRKDALNFVDQGAIDEARDVYKLEISRRRKSNAKILIDKMPIASANAKMLSNIFPGKKYIFAIRHPYDVVISCLKQAFSPNIAMDSFTTFLGACRTYDYVMTQWFSVYTIDSPQICYVRYDDLVNDMRTTMDRVFRFLEIEWSDEVKGFAKNAELRANNTPSYLKVRQGLGIGVQSSWKNYKFLFDAPEARLLDKWVKFFEYEA